MFPWQRKKKKRKHVPIPALALTVEQVHENLTAEIRTLKTANTALHERLARLETSAENRPDLGERVTKLENELLAAVEAKAELEADLDEIDAIRKSNPGTQLPTV